MKLGFITLGCDKNTVDSERYLAQLADRGAEYTDDLTEAEVIVINTAASSTRRRGNHSTRWFRQVS